MDFKKSSKAIILIIIAFAIGALGQKQKPKNIHSEVAFLSVGQGDAILIQQGTWQMLIDGGPGTEVLEKLGNHVPITDTTIENIVLTHPDADHINGLIDVLQKYKVNNVITSGFPCQKAVCNMWDDLMKEEKVVHVTPGNTIAIKNGGIEILWPQELHKDHNENSIAMCLTIFDHSFLLTGDAGIEVEEKLITTNSLGRCRNQSILKAGHHGSKHSTGDLLLNTINPRYVIFSSGLGNSYGHPHYDVIEKVESRSIPYYRTDTSGTIAFTFDQQGNMLIQPEHDKIKE